MTEQGEEWVPEFEGQRPPFQPGNELGARPGNDLALRHGAFSSHRVDPIAGELSKRCCPTLTWRTCVHHGGGRRCGRGQGLKRRCSWSTAAWNGAAGCCAAGIRGRVGAVVGHQADIDEGHTLGVSTADAARIKRLEQENRELKRANEILKRAASFFGAELDRQHKK